MSCYRVEPGAIVLTVRLTPRADRDAITGISTLADGQVVASARVRAVPEDGAANKALIALLAKRLPPAEIGNRTHRRGERAGEAAAHRRCAGRSRGRRRIMVNGALD